MIGFIIAVVLVDLIALRMQSISHQDERFRLHQLIIERNCSIAAVLSIVSVIGIRIYSNFNLPAAESLPFDPLLLGVLGVMVLTQFTSTMYLKFRM